jgi:alpha-amylase/alpha-mannosidase (GH57 family)
MPYLVLHGHFYQPPRENPWTEEIDREPTAEPFHDWNERINEECYRANAFARVLGGDGRVVDILNNYAYLSFNFGPTLLSWLRAKAPDVYDRLRQGDALSRARLGHGNAIAQAYNHLIMPLANTRDKITQVCWGLADFRFHFGREAEALWLAETAVDYETLDVLAAAGLRYVILSPTQAARARPLDSLDHQDWRDVSNGSIDPSRAYLCRLKSGRSIAAFFYDGPLAHAASYGDLLADSQSFVARLAEAVDPHRFHPQLIHLATDGETFGHHKKFAERTLIYAFTHQAPAQGFSLTNYGAYLDLAPPQWEVEIKPNTAWSCAHGVGRWSADCGCRADGPAHWHQRWRAPLRAALDRLRDSLARIYEREAPALLGDPWEGRDAYGEVLPDRTPERVDAFLESRARRRLTADERARALTLLEMQKHALFMYTSCGWFFSELSGLESTQVLKYAARAIDLASRFEAAGLSHGADGLTAQLLKDLEQAESNEPRYGNGAEVYRQLVLPAAIGPERVAASYAINSLVKAFPVRHRRHAYLLEQTESHSRQIGQYRQVCGHVHLTSDFTGEKTGWGYAAFHFEGYNFAASVLRRDDPDLSHEICDRLRDLTRSVTQVSDYVSALRTAVAPTIYGLGDLPSSDRRRVMKHLEEEVLGGVASSFEQIYHEHMGTIAALRAANMIVPPELRVAAEYTLSHRLERAAGALAHEPGADHEDKMKQVLDLAARDGLRLERGWAARTLEKAVVERVQALVAAPDEQARPGAWEQVVALIEAAARLGFKVCPARAQEMMLDYLRARAAVVLQMQAGEAHGLPAPQRDVLRAALTLADQLDLSPRAVAAPSTSAQPADDIAALPF